jgi:hypothetical protein
MARGGEAARQRYGRSVRTSHAKAHGLLKGELRVLDGLLEGFRQGLFAIPRTYPVVVRLAHVPGEFVDDRRISTPRGFAIKIFDVKGEKLPGHETHLTQDFLLNTGRTFIAPSARAFLTAITATETANVLPEGVKAAVSALSRAGNRALNAFGIDSANLDFFGHPFHHPLGESYFSQAAFRYGDYIAKLRVAPASQSVRFLAGKTLVPEDEDGLRTAVTRFFRRHGAEYEVAVQLCVDLDRMPVENPTAEWPEDESPYVPVARIALPPQEAFSAARQQFDDNLSFCPAHSLAAHRPLGSVNRARLRAYRALGTGRRAENGRPVTEPRSIAEMPD